MISRKIIPGIVTAAVIGATAAASASATRPPKVDQSKFKGKGTQNAAFVFTPYYEFGTLPQDKGLPYTRSSAEYADKVFSDCIALHELGRYVMVYGKKVRIDNSDILRGEPVLKDGKVYVPADFMNVLFTKKDAKFAPAPDYISKYVWVYDLPPVKMPRSIMVKPEKINGKYYIDLAEAVKAAGLKAKVDRGLWLIAEKDHRFPRLSEEEMDNLITRFDTPEKYIDPELAAKYIPTLHNQGMWYTHVKIKPGQEKMFDGPEEVFPLTPKSEYDYSGINTKLFGSKVPAPGVWPRLFFSPEDIPAMRERLKHDKQMQKSFAELEFCLKKSFLDPKTDDGKVFDQLASGKVDKLTWTKYKHNNTIQGQLPSTFDGQKPSVYSSHINYNSTGLTSLAVYALLSGDDQLGKKVADATYNYYKLIEPMLDEYLKNSDSEFGFNFDTANGSTTQWRGRHGVVPHMDYFFALDLNGRFFTPEQKEFFRKYIAKATYGVRTNGGDGPRRNWRDINHVTWHLTHLLGLLAIEGLEGCDPEALASGKELVGDFVEWGVNKYGTTFESNGKSGGGMVFQLLSMIALARRGDNYFAHPHWRKYAEGQVQNMSPFSDVAVSSGSWSGGTLNPPNVMVLHTAYPGNRYAELLLTRRSDYDPATFDVEAYKKDMAANPKKYQRLRMPSPSYPDFVMGVFWDSEWKKTTRKDANAPLDFVDDITGILSSYSSNEEDAAWLHFWTRANHYMGSGHHHADAGMFHFSSDKVDWIRESRDQMLYDGAFHNQVLIDGKAAPEGPMARPEWLGAKTSPLASFASGDLSNSYRYGWSCQFMLFDNKSNWAVNDGKEWELATDPYQLKFFKGTQRYKMRPWWATGVFSNWFPNFQYSHNPVEYVYRTAGLVKGKHPYAVIADDLKKDDKSHLYCWTAYLGRRVWRIRDDKLPPNMLLLGVDPSREEKPHHAGIGAMRHIKKGSPALLAVVLSPTDTEDPNEALIETVTVRGQRPPVSRRGWQAESFSDRLQSCYRGVEAKFRILLIPVKYGETYPEITVNGDEAEIKWPDQKDVISFSKGRNGAAEVSVSRDGKKIF